MAEVTLVFRADGKQVVQVSEEISAAYKKLNATSIAEIQKAKSEITAAYEKIRNSGVASQSEIRQAWAAKNKEIQKLDEQLVGSSQGAIAKLKTCWVQYAVAAGIAIGLAMKVSEYMQLGAKAMQAEQSFKAVADAYHVNASKIIEDMRRATKSTVDESSLQQKALKALAADIPAKYLEGLSKAAVVGARVMGTSVEQSFEGVIDSISSNMPRSLKRMTLLTKEEMAAINKAFSAGFEEIANTAMTQFVIKNAEEKFKKLGAEVDSAAERMQKFHAAWKEFHETMGKVAIAVFPKVWDFFKFLGIGAAGAAEAVSSIAAGMIKIQGIVSGKGESAADWFSKQADKMGQYRRSLTIDINKDLGIKDYKRPDASTLPNLAGVGLDLPDSLKQDALAQIRKFEEEKAKAKEKVWTAEELKHMAAAKQNLEAELQAEQTAFTKSIEDVKSFYADRLEIEKKGLEENIGYIDYAAKTGVLSIQEAENLKQQYLEDSYQKQEGIARTGQIAIANIINTESEKIGGIYKSLFGISKEEDKPALISKEKAFLSEVSWLRISSERETGRQIFGLQVEGRTKTLATDLAALEAIKQERIKTIQFELELTQAGIKSREELETTAMSQEKDRVEWMYQHRMISEQDYYARLKQLIKDDLDIRSKALDDQIEALYNTRVAEINLENTTKERTEEILKELTRAYEEYYGNRKKIALNAAGEIEKTNREAGKNFSSGWEEGIDDYIKHLDDRFSRGKELAADFAREGERFLIDMWESPKDAAKNFFNFLLFELKKTIAQFLMNPIMVQLKGVMGGGAAVTGVGTGGGLGELLASSLGIGESTLGGLVGMGGLGYGIGGVGGAIGGSLGYLGGSTIAAPLTMFLSEALTSSGFSIAFGAALEEFIPIIGGIIGGLLGKLIGGLFSGSKKEPEVAMEFNPAGTSLDGSFQGVAGGAYAFKYKNFEGAKLAEEMATVFQDVRENVMDALEGLGMDISGFENAWYKQVDIAGKSEEEVQQILKDMLGEYIEFASGIDFSQWQKSGEALVDTIDRIISAWAAFPKVIESVNDYIAAIEDNYDAIAKWKEAMVAADEQIAAIKKSLDEATDPADAIKYGQELITAVYEKYMAEKQLVEGLRDGIKNLEKEMAHFAIDMQSKIDGLLGTFNSIQLIWNRGAYIYDQLINNTNLSAQEKLSLLQEGVGLIDQWYQANLSQIQKKYADMQKADQERIKAEQDTLKAQEDAVSLQIDGLNKQLDVIKGWSSLLDSIKKTILDLKTGLTNPQDVFARLSIAKGELDSVMTLYQGSSGEARLKYAGQANELLQKYLSIAQEAYQRPSPEYQSIYDSVVGNLEMIQADAQGYSNQELAIQQNIESLQMEIKGLQEQSNSLQQQQVDYSAQMQADIDTLNQQAASYYEWAKTEGVALYQEAIKDMKDKLASIIGDKTVEEYLNDLQLAAVTELVLIRDVLEEIARKLEVPGFASGGYVSSPTLAWVGEKGPEYIVPANRMNQSSGQTITIAPQITVNASGDVDEEKLARKIVQITEQSIKSGRMRRVVKEAVAYG